MSEKKEDYFCEGYKLPCTKIFKVGGCVGCEWEYITEEEKLLLTDGKLIDAVVPEGTRVTIKCECSEMYKWEKDYGLDCKICQGKGYITGNVFEEQDIKVFVGHYTEGLEK